jgi:hypothetical protein
VTTSASQRGTEAAYGRRRPLETELRKAAYWALRLAGLRYQRAFPDYLEFIPEVRSPEEFADLSSRVACYLGDAGVPLYLAGPRYELDPALVPHIDPVLVRDPGWVPRRPGGEGQLVVHRVTPATIRRLATSRTPGWVVDPSLFRRAEQQYFDLRNATSWPTYEPIELGLRRLRERAAGATTAFVLATGPSASLVDVEAVDADVRITCNSAVRDVEMMRKLRPQILCFTDPVFHLGPSRYAAGFRRDAVRIATEIDALVVCGARLSGPLLGLEPSLRDRLVVVPWQDAGPWRWPTDRNPTVRQGGNVMTTLMLPLAFLLADDVTIAGSDGRRPTEQYFWKHNTQLQYSDELMKTVFDTHPSFFRHVDYGDYYDQHCEFLEELIQAGEAAGKTVRALTPSWIPALVKRGAPPFPEEVDATQAT